MDNNGGDVSLEAELRALVKALAAAELRRAVTENCWGLSRRRGTSGPIEEDKGRERLEDLLLAKRDMSVLVVLPSRVRQVLCMYVAVLDAEDAKACPARTDGTHAGQGKRRRELLFLELPRSRATGKGTAVPD